MENDPKTFWVRAHLWQHLQVLHPIAAKSEEDALKQFREATKTARDVVIEGCSEDPEELIGPRFGDETITDVDDTSPDRIIN